MKSQNYFSFPSSCRRVAAFAAIGAFSIAALGCADDPATTTTDAKSSGAQTAKSVSCSPKSLPKAIDTKQIRDADVTDDSIKLVTHDSFEISEATLRSFTVQTGIEVTVVKAGDAGEIVSKSVLAAGKPLGDVLFGIDNTFLCKGTKAGLFVPYQSQHLAAVPKELRLAVDNLATPIDVGDVCLNYALKRFPNPSAAPHSLDDLLSSSNKDQFVTQNPETSSPGMAFLLATIAKYGPNGWQEYWKKLRANGVEVTSGWEDAYGGSFNYGDGKRSIVTSYASSPVADVYYSDPPREEPVIGVVTDSCFRQVEFAGVLRGTTHPEAAALLVDFLLDETFQADIPLNMFVEPANSTVELPEAYKANRVKVSKPLTVSPEEIEANRDKWTQQWTELVLR